ncbi:hypothetical protein [Natrinema gelatinilyticum]|uniref:hypothetical protein n=1 Tax=Natrinema gelatinilyticum TaxID=2961571 RepID=UPI0020C371B5|nr:hypothetical protein [Natrinema gelatinilyticum]
MPVETPFGVVRPAVLGRGSFRIVPEDEDEPRDVSIEFGVASGATQTDCWDPVERS